MPGRKYNSTAYRYGFNGKEKDDEGEIGSLTTYDYGFRIYNPAIAKFLSVDPLTRSYPQLTPYQFASNRPIDGIDLDGLEYLDADNANLNFFNVKLSTSNYVEIENQSYNISLGNMTFADVQRVTIAGNDYYDIGQHLYYSSGWSGTGSRQNQVTRNSQVGIQLMENIQSLPNHPDSYSSPPTWTDPNESYAVANDYSDCGGMCFAITMARVNRAYSDVSGTEPLSLFPTRARNQDYNISGTIVAGSVPNGYLGYGVGGALARNGYGTLVDDAGVWAGELQEGAPIQYWNGGTQADAIQSLRDGNASGHSFIFSNYTYDVNGNINGFEAYDYNGARTFNQNSNLIFLGANVEDGN